MATIMVIRHAEKPVGPRSPHGVDLNGDPNPESLTPRGWQRAGALVNLFSGGPATSLGSNPLPAPTHLFASMVAIGSSSRRPRETLDPLAERLGITIDTGYAKAQVPDLAQAAIAGDGVVLIAWEHNLIPSLAAAIRGNAEAIPKVWPDDRYDVVWIFEEIQGSPGHTFLQHPQLLLAGDRADVIAQ